MVDRCQELLGETAGLSRVLRPTHPRCGRGPLIDEVAQLSIAIPNDDVRYVEEKTENVRVQAIGDDDWRGTQ